MLKGVHPTDLDEKLLKKELANQGDLVKNITNMKSKRTNKNLPAYFVNLQVSDNVRMTIESVKNLQKYEEKLVLYIGIRNLATQKTIDVDKII